MGSVHPGQKAAKTSSSSPAPPACPLLPADTGVLIGRKLIIDATTPIEPDVPSLKLIRPYKESVDLRDMISKLQRDMQK